MKKLLLLGIFTVLIFSLQAQQNELNPIEVAEGWELLFDGRTTNGWHNYGKDQVKGWAVKDGELIALGLGHGKGGDIVSDGAYENFELSVDWKIGPEANSGIFFGVIEDPSLFHGVHETGPEYQLIDDKGWPGDLKEWQKTGSNYAMHLTTSRPTKAVGQWNQSRIRVQGRHVEHWLNGEKVLEYERWNYDWEERIEKSKWKYHALYGRAVKGRIALQDHGKETRFRNIKIRKLPKAEELFNGHDLDGWKIYGTEKWYVDNGVLVCESGPDAEYGYLGTERTFKDMDLELEFKQEANGNSGVFFRSSIEGTKISGWQVEVAPPDHDTGGIYESYGRGWLIQIDPEHEHYLKMGDWNHMRIRLEGDRVRTWLNGHQMVDLRDEKIGTAEGSIALQIHSGGGIKVQWRNIRVY